MRTKKPKKVLINIPEYVCAASVGHGWGSRLCKNPVKFVRWHRPKEYHVMFLCSLHAKRYKDCQPMEYDSQGNALIRVP